MRDRIQELRDRWLALETQKDIPQLLSEDIIHILEQQADIEHHIAKLIVRGDQHAK